MFYDTTTKMSFCNSRNVLPKVEKALPKRIVNGFLGVGYKPVAYSKGNGFITFAHGREQPLPKV
jgi:hypothetical protein